MMLRAECEAQKARLPGAVTGTASHELRGGLPPAAMCSIARPTITPVRNGFGPFFID